MFNATNEANNKLWELNTDGHLNNIISCAFSSHGLYFIGGCKDDLYIYKRNCNCQDNQYYDGNNCIDCSNTLSYCQKCYNSTLCVECDSNYYVGGSGTCVACSTISNCVDCDGNGDCTTCLTGYSPNPNGNGCLFDCSSV